MFSSRFSKGKNSINKGIPAVGNQKSNAAQSRSNTAQSQRRNLRLCEQSNIKSVDRIPREDPSRFSLSNSSK